MKRLTFYFILLIYLLSHHLNVLAGDTIRFSMSTGGGMHTHFIIATLNKQFTIDWGDGTIETHTGIGEYQFLTNNYSALGKYRVTISSSEDCKISYFRCFMADTLDFSKCPSIGAVYCFSALHESLQSINVANCNELENIWVLNNRLSILDLSDCKVPLKDVVCPENQLTQIILEKTERIVCYENRLLLSDLYRFSEMISDRYNKILGLQVHVQKRIYMGDSVDFSDQNEFDGIKTVFYVFKGSVPAPHGDYTITNGIITFHKAGQYVVQMTNAAIISHPQYPAIVQAPFNVINFIPVQEITNIPETAIVGTEIYLSSRIVLPANATYTSTTWTISDVGTTGAFFTGSRLNTTAPGIVVVTATIKDGIAFDVPYTQDFAIEILPLSINKPASVLNMINLYPNPTTGELRIESGDLIINRIEVLDIRGNIISLHPFNILSANHKIDISYLNSSIYFVKVITEQGEIVKKVVKQ
jgi:hypothetical protein